MKPSDVIGQRAALHGVVVLMIAATLGGTLAACGGDSDDDSGQSKAAATMACLPSYNKKLPEMPPSDVPLPTGATKPYMYTPEGATKYYFYKIAGSPTTLASMRDAYDTQLTGMGFKITDTDEETNAEAESSFSGPHSGSTKWDNLCTGFAVFQLSITS